MATIPGFPYTEETNEACGEHGCPNKHMDDLGTCETCYLRSLEQGKGFIRQNDGSFAPGPYKRGDLVTGIMDSAAAITNGTFDRYPFSHLDYLATYLPYMKGDEHIFETIVKLRKAHPTVLTGTDRDLDPGIDLPRRGDREDFHSDG